MESSTMESVPLASKKRLIQDEQRQVLGHESKNNQNPQKKAKKTEKTEKTKAVSQIQDSADVIVARSLILDLTKCRQICNIFKEALLLLLLFAWFAWSFPLASAYYLTVHQHPIEASGCGSWASTSYHWDTENSWGDDSSASGTLPKGTYGPNPTMYFCTGEVDSVPVGSYCFYRNGRGQLFLFHLPPPPILLQFPSPIPPLESTCPPGFTPGTRSQDEEDSNNRSGGNGTLEDRPYITNPGNYPTWYFCCGRDDPSTMISFDAIRDQLPVAFTLFQKGGTCQVINGRKVSAGSVYWDDQDTGNQDATSGTLPDGVYDSNTQMQYCTYTASNLPYPPTSVAITALDSITVQVSWTPASSAQNTKLDLFEGSSLKMTLYSEGGLSRSFCSLTPNTRYTIRIHSGILPGPVYETVGKEITFITCNTGLSGLSCLPVCVFPCVNGNCTGPNICSCELGWGGNDCNQCNQGYFPKDASTCASCPNCNNGSCFDGSTGTGLCGCQAGFQGIYCDEALPNTSEMSPIEQWVPIGVYALIGILCLILYFIARRKNPEATNVLILIAGISVVECATDGIFLSATYRLPDRAIFYSSLFFTIFPMLLNSGLVAFVFVWEMKRQDGKGNYLMKHSVLASVIGMLSMTNVSLLRLLDSKIFHLEVFSMDWEEGTHLKGKVFGLVSDILDNIPQIIIQAFYLSQHGADAVGVAAMVASSISLLCGIVHKLLLLLALRFYSKSKREFLVDAKDEDAHGGAYFAMN